MSEAATHQISSAVEDRGFYFQVKGAEAALEGFLGELDMNEEIAAERELFVNACENVISEKNPAYFDRVKFDAFVSAVTKYLNEH